MSEWHVTFRSAWTLSHFLMKRRWYRSLVLGICKVTEATVAACHIKTFYFVCDTFVIVHWACLTHTCTTSHSQFLWKSIVTLLQSWRYVITYQGTGSFCLFLRHTHSHLDTHTRYLGAVTVSQTVSDCWDKVSFMSEGVCMCVCALKAWVRLLGSIHLSGTFHTLNVYF